MGKAEAMKWSCPVCGGARTELDVDPQGRFTCAECGFSASRDEIAGLDDENDAGDAFDFDAKESDQIGGLFPMEDIFEPRETKAEGDGETEIEVDALDLDPDELQAEAPVASEADIEWLDEGLGGDALPTEPVAAVDNLTPEEGELPDLFDLESEGTDQEPLFEHGPETLKDSSDEFSPLALESTGPTVETSAAQPVTMLAAPPVPISLFSRLLRGVLLTLGLLLSLAVVQLLCWWVLRMDPLNVALMVPKSMATWTVPHALTEDGRRELANADAPRPSVVVPPIANLPDSDAANQENDPPTTEIEDPAPAADAAATDPADDSEEAVLPEEETTDAATDTEVEPDPSGSDQPTNSTDQLPESEPAADLPSAELPSGTESSPESDAAEPRLGSDDKATDDLALPSLTESEPTATPEVAPDVATMPPSEEPADDDAEELFGSTDDPPAAGDDLFSEPESTPPAEPELPRGPLNTPAVDRDRLVTAVSEAQKLTEALGAARRSGANATELRNTAKEFFVAYCKLAEAATFVDPSAAKAELESAMNLLGDLALDASKLRMIGTTSVGWMQRDLGNGLLTAGRIESISSAGNYQEMTIRPMGKDERIVVLTDARSASDQLTTGKDVVLMGYIVRDPAAQLPDYVTDQPTLVWLRNLIVPAF